AADAAADDDAGPPGIGNTVPEPGRLQRLTRGHDRELDEAIHALRVLAVDAAVRREVLHFAREARLVIGRVEPRDGPCPGLAVDQVLPADLDVVADGRDDSRSGHEHPRSFTVHASPLSGAARRSLAGVLLQV